LGSFFILIWKHSHFFKYTFGHFFANIKTKLIK